jgi:hypothetical protein
MIVVVLIQVQGKRAVIYGRFHADEDCKGVLARDRNVGADGEYRSIDIEQMPGDAPACQFCFPGLPDAAAVRKQL